MTLTFDEAQKLGWATEKTLQELVSAGKGTPQLLKLIGERFKINQAALDRAAQGLSTSVKAATAAVGSSTAAATSQQAQFSADLDKLNKRLGATMADQLRTMTNARDPQSIFGGFASRLSGVGRQFEDAGGAAGIFAKQLMIAGAALSVFTDLYQRLTEVMNAMQGVYASGVLVQDGLSGLVQAASYSGMGVREFADILSKNAAVAVTLGTRSTINLSRQFQRLTNFSGNLMMTQEEGGRAFFETMEMMRVSGEMRGMSEEQLARRGVALLNNFNELAIATGRNRDELRRQTAELMRQPLTSLMSRMLPQEGRQRLTDFTANMVAQFGNQAGLLTGMAERVASAGGSFGLIDDNMKPLLSIIPGFGQALQQAANNNLSGAERAAALARVFDNLGERGEAQLRTLAMANPALAGQVEQLLQMREQSKRAREQLESEARARNMTTDALLAERRETERRMAAVRGSMNGANAAVNRLTNAFSKVAASLSGVIMPVIDVFTAAVNVVSYVFEKLADVIEPVVDAFDFVRRTMMTFVNSVLNLVGLGEEGDNVSGSSTAGVIGTVATVLASGALIRIATGFIGKIFSGSAISGMLAGGASAVGALASRIPGAGFLGRGAATAAGGATTAAATAAGGAATAAGGAAARGASAVGTLLGGLGSGIGAILTGLAQGMAAFANPMVVLGAAAIGASIAAIGAGIAGATWIMGRALPTLAEGLQAFTAIDGNALSRTGSGMVSIGAGLAAMAAGNILSSVSSLATILPNLFGGGPMGQMRQFASMAPQLEIAATSISLLADSLTRLTGIDLAPLQGLSAIVQFANGMNERAISNLSRTVNNPQFVESIRNITAAIQPPVGPPGAGAAPGGPAAPVITTAELNQRTVDYYDTSLANFAEMLELMRIANRHLREGNDLTERGTTTIESAVRSISRV